LCDPVTIGVLAVASTALAAGGQLYAASAQANQAKYAANVATENRKHELAARDDARKRGEMEQMRHWRRVAQMQGQQRAELGAAGLDLGFGSALDIQDETLAMGFEDSTIINENTAKEVKGYEINAANYANQAKAHKMTAKAAKVSGYIGAASTILGGASQLAGGFKAPGGGAPARGSSGGDWYSRYGGLNG
jgi:hypothetical protein